MSRYQFGQTLPQIVTYDLTENEFAVHCEVLLGAGPAGCGEAARFALLVVCPDGHKVTRFSCTSDGVHWGRPLTCRSCWVDRGWSESVAVLSVIPL